MSEYKICDVEKERRVTRSPTVEEEYVLMVSEPIVMVEKNGMYLDSWISDVVFVEEVLMFY